jgi:adiponectin receptor
LLVCGSTFPPFYYGFYCDILIQTIYLVVIGSCCTTVYIISIFDFIHQEKYRKMKGIMYGSLGILAGVPTFHLYLREYYNY